MNGSTQASRAAATDKRVLVAGATGYLGGFVAQELKDRGHFVRALVRSPEKLEPIRDRLDEVFKADVTRPETLEQVARYLLRPPLSLERLRYSDGEDEVVYSRKGPNGRAGGEERIDALEFLARVLAHIPPPRVHLVRYLGHYSNVARGRRKKGKEEPLTPGRSEALPGDQG